MYDWRYETMKTQHILNGVELVIKVDLFWRLVFWKNLFSQYTLCYWRKSKVRKNELLRRLCLCSVWTCRGRNRKYAWNIVKESYYWHGLDGDTNTWVDADWQLVGRQNKKHPIKNKKIDIFIKHGSSNWLLGRWAWCSFIAIQVHVWI